MYAYLAGGFTEYNGTYCQLTLIWVAPEIYSRWFINKMIAEIGLRIHMRDVMIMHLSFYFFQILQILQFASIF